jgi:peptidylprolyl isomerase
MIAALSAMLGLSACGGGSDDGGSSSPPKTVHDASALVKTDTVVGTGTEAMAGATVTVNYTLWLYDPNATGSKGTKVEGPAPLTGALSSLITGWQQGVPGMKVGGKRTLIVPSNLGYGAQSSSSIPANSGLVFDIELTAVTNPPPVHDAPALVKTDASIGTGPEVPANSIVKATYSLWLYDPTVPTFKGTLLEGPGTLELPLSSLIAGWRQGVPGMKVGGKRTLIVPSTLAYGTTGGGAIPPNAGLVFDIEVTDVTLVYDAPNLIKTDTLVGTGTEVLAGKSVRAKYAIWLYDSTKADFKGKQLLSPTDGNFTLTSSTSGMIEGLVQGVPGMKVGGKRTLVIPSSLAFGSTGNGPVPANSGLVYDFEVLSTN